MYLSKGVRSVAGSGGVPATLLVVVRHKIQFCLSQKMILLFCFAVLVSANKARADDKLNCEVLLSSEGADTDIAPEPQPIWAVFDHPLADRDYALLFLWDILTQVCLRQMMLEQKTSGSGVGGATPVVRIREAERRALLVRRVKISFFYEGKWVTEDSPAGVRAKYDVFVAQLRSLKPDLEVMLVDPSKALTSKGDEHVPHLVFVSGAPEISPVSHAVAPSADAPSASGNGVTGSPSDTNNIGGIEQFISGIIPNPGILNTSLVVFQMSGGPGGMNYAPDIVNTADSAFQKVNFGCQRMHFAYYHLAIGTPAVTIGVRFIYFSGFTGP
ncbi:MAG: hypothetical protein K1X29_09455 [Bdellovibrionales bacterium]|nr:hypothetical protein [Bdellovibrionales bacterium]